MWAYIVRRILLTIPTVLGIVVLTFVLFGLVATDPARAYAGKNPSAATLRAIRARMGLDKPKWVNLGPTVQSIKVNSKGLRVETDVRHGLEEGGLVSISGLTPGYLDGNYKVTAIDAPTIFFVAPPAKFKLPAATTTPTTEATTSPSGIGAAPEDDASELLKNPGGRVRPVGLGKKIAAFFDSQFFDLLFFRFPKSMRFEESVWKLIAVKGPVSLTVQLPAFLITVALQLVVALYVAASRGKAIDYVVTVLTVVTLSVPAISVYLLLQWWLGARLEVFPLAGWKPGIYALQFAALPILATVMVTIGGGARFYRTVALDEINSDYIRTARAKGAPKRRVLLTHVLRNIMIPVITNTVTVLPFLVFGALILEQIFQIPGLGNLLVQAIFNQDRSIVMGVTYIISITYCVALLVNDILYTLVDPRVALK